MLVGLQNIGQSSKWLFSVFVCALACLLACLGKITGDEAMKFIETIGITVLGAHAVQSSAEAIAKRGNGKTTTT